jgi:hypothetical protein
MIAGIIGITPGRIAPCAVTNSQYRENRALTPLPESLVSPLRPQNRGFQRPCRYRASTIKQKSRGILKTPGDAHRRKRRECLRECLRRIAGNASRISRKRGRVRPALIVIRPLARSRPLPVNDTQTGKRSPLNYKNIPWFLPLADQMQ